MRCVPINYAEAIIEPLYDGDSSGYDYLSEYDIKIKDNAKVNIDSAWASVEIHVVRGETGTELAVMEKACDIDVSKYDIFRIFGVLSELMTLKVTLKIDGIYQTVIDLKHGITDSQEIDGKFKGNHLQSVRLSFGLNEAQINTKSTIRWFGLANEAKQKEYEQTPSPYTPDWPGCFNTDNPSFKAECNLYFDDKHLEELRGNMQKESQKLIYERMVESAKSQMKLEPEKLIGEYVPFPMRRFTRDRDMKRQNMTGSMEILALVGLLSKNIEMSIMAARMALSVAHCNKWTESIMGCLPGTTWHHRSFTEESCCRACAIVLDLAGYVLTPFAREVIIDAIVMKGLPRIESDFKRQEYIREMNQGIIFNGGRLHALLAIEKYYPRYKMKIEEAASDLFEMIDKYVQDDGGVAEGPGYWCYTFALAIPQFYLLSKYYGKTMKEYVSESVKKTLNYGLVMQSIKGKGMQFLSVNDAHPGGKYDFALAASSCLLSNDDEWKGIYSNMLKDPSKAGGSLYWLSIAPLIKDLPAEYTIKPTFTTLKTTGKIKAVRSDSKLNMINFFYISGIAYNCHYNDDKGSFLLESSKESLLIDRGVCAYSNPEHTLMALSDRHNMLCPYDSDGDYYTQKCSGNGKIIKSEMKQDVLHIISDETEAWGQELFVENRREVKSPDARTYIINDTGELKNPVGGVALRFHTLCPIEKCENGYIIKGETADVRIIADGWIPDEITGERYGINGEMKPVNTITFKRNGNDKYSLTTRITIE